MVVDLVKGRHGVGKWGRGVIEYDETLSKKEQQLVFSFSFTQKVIKNEM